MIYPTEKTIANVTVSVRRGGWPHWVDMRGAAFAWTLNHEEARDLLYAMQRIVAFIDENEAFDVVGRLAREGKS